MFLVIKVIWCSVFLFYFEVVRADYANSTINTAKAISDDFRTFQQTGKRVSRRDGRGLFTFDTKNDDIQVYSRSQSARNVLTSSVNRRTSIWCHRVIIKQCIKSSLKTIKAQKKNSKCCNLHSTLIVKHSLTILAMPHFLRVLNFFIWIYESFVLTAFLTWPQLSDDFTILRQAQRKIVFILFEFSRVSCETSCFLTATERWKERSFLWPEAKWFHWAI